MADLKHAAEKVGITEKKPQRRLKDVAEMLGMEIREVTEDSKPDLVKATRGHKSKEQQDREVQEEEAERIEQEEKQRIEAEKLAQEQAREEQARKEKYRQQQEALRQKELKNMDDEIKLCPLYFKHETPCFVACGWNVGEGDDPECLIVYLAATIGEVTSQRVYQ